MQGTRWLRPPLRAPARLLSQAPASAAPHALPFPTGGALRERAGSGKALSTVTAIIDGMGSCGAALGPLLTGHLAALPGGFDNVFYMLYAASAAAAALLARLVVREARPPRRRV